MASRTEVSASPLRTNTKTVVDADFDHVDVLLDVEIARSGCAHADSHIAQLYCLAAKKVVVVFGKCGPVVYKCPLNAATHNPAPTRRRARGITRRERRERTTEVPIQSGKVLCGVAIVRPSGATLAVDQEAIEGIAEPARRACEPVGLAGECQRATVLAGKKRIHALTLDIGPGEIACKPDDPIAGELVVASNLAAAERADLARNGD